MEKPHNHTEFHRKFRVLQRGLLPAGGRGVFLAETARQARKVVYAIFLLLDSDAFFTFEEFPKTTK
jgi:hypothetical protein